MNCASSCETEIGVYSQSLPYTIGARDRIADTRRALMISASRGSTSSCSVFWNVPGGNPPLLNQPSAKSCDPSPMPSVRANAAMGDKPSR